MSENETEKAVPPAESPEAAPPAPAEAAESTAPAAEGAAAELQKLRAERDDFYNRYLRSVADLDNYRRRVLREKDELRQFANRDLIESLLPVYENLGLAITSAQQAADAEVIAKGVALVLEQFRGVLTAKGVREINPAVGSEFDPHQHESIAHAPSADVPEEKIVQVVRTGFALNDRILRPASVVLSGGPAPAPEAAAKE